MGDINGDGIPDIVSRNNVNQVTRSFVLFGGSENLAALDQADGTTMGTSGFRLSTRHQTLRVGS